LVDCKRVVAVVMPSTIETERRRRQAHLWMTVYSDIVLVELQIDGVVVWEYVGIRYLNWDQVNWNALRARGR